MKMKISLLLALLFTLSLLTGCSKESADKYAGETITSLKEEKAEKFAFLLEDGIAESNATYVLQFPEELKASYQDFLQESFKSMEFEVQKAKKKNDGSYAVKISFTPIDLAATTESTNASYVESMTSSDLTAEVTALLTKDAKAVKGSPQYQDKILATLEVTENDKGFTISDKALKKFLAQALPGYMQPYNAVCEILDARGFMQSYLDASFKGELTQFAKYTHRTEEEAQEWYESDIFEPPSDLSAAYNDRYVAALNGIMKQCKYTVGIPKKADGIYNYTIDITYSPNNSFVKSWEELENGTYYSTEAVSKALVEIMEKYSASPVYGDETTTSVSLNLTAMIGSNNDDGEYQKLGAAILPVPE